MSVEPLEHKTIPPAQFRDGIDLPAISTLAKDAASKQSILLIVTPDIHTADRLSRELPFFAPDLPLLLFPNWETLTYDHFSPPHDIISERLLTLYQLPLLKKGIVLIDIHTALQKLCPTNYIQGNSFIFKQGETLDREAFRERLQAQGYKCVEQVIEHGEFAIRGSLLDVYPMGSKLPYRLDLLGDEIDSIRTFSPDTQRTLEKMDAINLLPAHEFPLDEAGIAHFRQAWRNRFTGNPANCPLYNDVSQGFSSAGIEYYLPLFFDQMASIFDYLPASEVLCLGEVLSSGSLFLQDTANRYEQYRYDLERPILAPQDLFLSLEEFSNLTEKLASRSALLKKTDLTSLGLAPEAAQSSLNPLANLATFLEKMPSRILICVESKGRLEVFLEKCRAFNLHPVFYKTWQSFLADDKPFGISVAPLEQSVKLESLSIVLISEAQLYGQRVLQRERRKNAPVETGTLIRQLSELSMGTAVVHIEHGVGLYQGLEIIKTEDSIGEYLMLEYADKNKLYVPVANLHLITRYGGMDSDSVSLNKLGSNQWEKDREKAVKRAYDVAASLLALNAERHAKEGFAFAPPSEAYQQFADNFLFEETPDQASAIEAVIKDMTLPKPMDRLVCGDVGFGKTEIAMRAAFLAVQSHKQVAILVPTTLLAQQHYESFQDRFANTAVKIDLLSRFRTTAEQKNALEKITDGKVDILIGTHKLLQPSIHFKNLGLIVIDEEHRFGVTQKEKLKALRAEVDILTLTATPIPRTLNMALSDVRDLSIIATPPAKRLAIKTFLYEYSRPIIREAILREINRGGQVYFLHNNINTIVQRARELEELLPEAKIHIAHGQLRKQELEKIMADFYHQRFNVLLCTTIIETGIDIPSANTIIMERADKFGLAQLHQLRGRVGRSHHQAYAYLLTPPKEALTPDAEKRLDAITAIEDLGAGFMLASQDLEIRGAGEFLGEEQTGHIQNIGLTLYMEFLERAVASLKAGKTLDLNQPLSRHTEVDLGVTALIPEEYIHDVHTRLVLYKRIAGASDKDELWDLQVEMIDRFGLMPEALKTLFLVTELKLIAEKLGIRKISLSAESGRIDFDKEPKINVAELIKLIQLHPAIYKLEGSSKLRFKIANPAPAKRAEFVFELLKKLA